MEIKRIKKRELIGIRWETNELNEHGEFEDLGHFLRKQGMIKNGIDCNGMRIK